MNRFFLLTLALAALTGCVTPPGKLTDADFNIRRIEFDLPIKDAVANFRDGLRYCGHETGMILVIPHGVPDCGSERSDGSVSCDLYLAKGFGMGKTQAVLGIVEFKPVPAAQSKSHVTFKVQTYVANQAQILTAWEKFALGRAQDVCK